MKTVHTTSWYFPDASGGVEVYIDSLVQGLRTYGVESTVAAPRKAKEEDSYKYNDVLIYRYPAPREYTKAQKYRQIAPDGFEIFANWLSKHQSKHQVDIYHQHSWRFDCGFHHLKIARELGMKTIVTIHMPEPVCLRGTMMQGNSEPCSGLIDEVGCGYCLGIPEKVPPWAIASLSKLPLDIGAGLEQKLLKADSVRVRQLGRTLGIPTLVREHRDNLEKLTKFADRIVVPSNWQYNAFVLNGVPKAKLILCRQGAAKNFQLEKLSNNNPNDNLNNDCKKRSNTALKLGFLGRWQETKGVQIIAEAVNRLSKDISVELILHGTHGDNYGTANRERVLAIAAQDPRIKIRPPLSRKELPTALANFDLLAVPSQWLETGPLVVLEAQAVGTPVLGSNLGGIAELVRHGVDGWLVPAKDIQAWSEAIAILAQDRDLLAKLRQGIQPARTMDTVVMEMLELYRQLLQTPNIN